MSALLVLALLASPADLPPEPPTPAEELADDEIEPGVEPAAAPGLRTESGLSAFVLSGGSAAAVTASMSLYTISFAFSVFGPAIAAAVGAGAGFAGWAAARWLAHRRVPIVPLVVGGLAPAFTFSFFAVLFYWGALAVWLGLASAGVVAAVIYLFSTPGISTSPTGVANYFALAYVPMAVGLVPFVFGALLAGLCLVGSVVAPPVVVGIMATRLGRPMAHEDDTGLDLWKVPPPRPPEPKPARKKREHPVEEAEEEAPPPRRKRPNVVVTGDAACVSRHELARAIERALAKDLDASAYEVRAQLTRAGTDEAPRVTARIEVVRSDENAVLFTRAFDLAESDCEHAAAKLARLVARQIEAAAAEEALTPKAPAVMER